MIKACTLRFPVALQEAQTWVPHPCWASSGVSWIADSSEGARGSPCGHAGPPCRDVVKSRGKGP